MANLFATKPLKTILDEAHETGEHSLRRALGPTNLITLGIGAIIGTGIFVITGTATAEHAGPAIILSFIFAALGCVFAGLCYAEFASLIPVAGALLTLMATQRWVKYLPGLSAGTWCWNMPSARLLWLPVGADISSAFSAILASNCLRHWQVRAGTNSSTTTITGNR